MCEERPQASSQTLCRECCAAAAALYRYWWRRVGFTPRDKRRQRSHWCQGLPT